MRLAFLLLLALSIGATCYRQRQVTSGFGTVTSMAFHDGSLYVAGKDGRVLKDGAVLFTVDTTDDVEAGLVGIAVDDAYVYVHYRRDRDGHAVVSRFPIGSATEDVLLDIGPSKKNHVGGGLQFGPDGKLYIGVGENTHRNRQAQAIDSLRGKILRINPDGTIPADNPWHNAVWALGFRNPFTFAFTPKGLYVNDVGQDSWEEIDLVERGQNYGWPVCEGACDKYVQPIYRYPHDGASAITGGVWWDGAYYFADFDQRWIRRLNPDGTATTILDDADYPIDLDVDGGKLYYLSLSGELYEVTPAP